MHANAQRQYQKQLQSKMQCKVYYLFYSQMSDKGRKKRLRNLVKRGYDAETQLLYLRISFLRKASEELQSQDLRFIVEELHQVRLITLKICITFQETANNPIGVAGASLLASSPWKNLQRLEMKSTKIGPKGAKEITKADFGQLCHLRIGFNELGNEGVKHLSLGRWKNLQELWLQGNHIGVDGCHWLSSANWQQLQHLSLWDNRIQIECSKKLLRLPCLTLAKLDLTFCNIKGCMNKHIQQFLKLKFVSISIME